MERCYPHASSRSTDELNMATSATITTEEGTYIAASQRPDGTWRKPRRVKDGYTPQEEVPLYESKGRQFSKQPGPHYPVGLDPALIRAAEARKDKAPIPGLFIEPKPATKKKKKKKATVSSLEEVNQVLSQVQISFEPQFQEVKSKRKQAVETPPPALTPPPDPTKRVKNLRKRLREIESIELKISSGELKKLEKDQLEKVARKREVLEEIRQLEDLSRD